MSVGIVRVAKMTSGSVKGIEIHDRREKEGVSHSNPDIDWERTKQNYDLHQAQNTNFNQAVKNRVAELNLPRAVRKDAIVMSQVLVTSEHKFFEGLSQEQQRQFFKDSYDFLVERYGRENIISATVHMDERTPHMHFNFVPVTDDGRLAAKSVLTRKSLIEQQTAFYEKVGVRYGLDRGMTKQERIEKGVDRKNMTMPEYKAYMASKQKLELEIDELSHKLTEKAQEVYISTTKLEGLQRESKALEAKSQALETKIDISQSFYCEIEKLPRGKINLFNKIEYTPEDAKTLLRAAKGYAFEKARSEGLEKAVENLTVKTSFSYAEKLEGELLRLRADLDASKKQAAKAPDLEQRCAKLQEQLQGFREFYDDLQLNILERVSDKDRKRISEELIPKWAQPQFEKDMSKLLDDLLPKKSKSYDMER